MRLPSVLTESVGRCCRFSAELLLKWADADCPLPLSHFLILLLVLFLCLDPEGHWLILALRLAQPHEPAAGLLLFRQLDIANRLVVRCLGAYKY